MQGVADIPASWDSLEEFANWYVRAGFPMLPPPGFASFRTDDAVAICTFRKPPYQVELYVIDDPLAVPLHEHPYVDVLQYVFDKRLADERGFALPQQLGHKLTLGKAHGAVAAGDRSNDGNGVLYTFERWPDGVEPSTVSAVWKGKTVGPKHKSLILSFFPDAYVDGDYVDITRTK